MLETNDGFEIARRDLEIRGPGEFLGARQSGAALLRFADPTPTRRWSSPRGAPPSGCWPSTRRRRERHVERWLGGRAHYLNA